MRSAGAVGLFLAAALSLTGCGTPGAPQPPSLRLPEPVTDLSAARVGNRVTLHWTMPRRTTDRLLIASQIRGAVTVEVCRRETSNGPCQFAGKAAFEPGAQGDFQESLPPPLSIGPLRSLTYYVQLKNKPSAAGRSAGLSNPAIVIAGSAPRILSGFAADVRADGVALHWDLPEPASEVRLHRRLLTPIAKSQTKEAKTSGGFAKQVPEVLDRDLLVQPPSTNAKAGALDSSVRFGATYEYSAQRIEHLNVDDKDMEIAGDPTPPLQVKVMDIFPPAVPLNLAAVLVPEEKTIDLSWQPDTEPDLAGYIVYRIDENGNESWSRISGEKPLAEPSFRDTTIQPGHRYRYAVTAIDQTGNESPRSTEATEAVPNP